MKIEAGLFDGMVLQRNRRDVSDAAFSGRTNATGAITVTVRRGHRVLAGFKSLRAGHIRNGRFQGRLRGLPVGGPYVIELQIEGRSDHVTDSLRLTDVWVGDVWIAGGQSNMQGYGRKASCPKPVPQVRAFYMDDRWGEAREPLHNLWACVDQIHVDLCGGRLVPPADERTHDGTLGPAIPFANEMWRRTRVPQAVLACAHGGTRMEQWDPKLKARGGKSLYGATIRRVKKNGGRIAGVIWYQGCSETEETLVPVYTARMKKLIAAFRRDTNNARLPVAIVQIAYVVGAPENPHWNAIRDQQRLLPSVISNVTCVPAMDATLTDLIHLDGASAARVGQRLARAMLHLLGDGRYGQAPIAYKTCAVEKGGVVRVEFDNVIGRLRSGSRPTGFCIVNSAGIDTVFSTTLDGSCVRLRTSIPTHELADARLFYGFGLNPYVNIEDEAGRPLPGLGPISIVKPRHTTPFIRRMKVSERQTFSGSIRSRRYPGSDLPLREHTYGSDFCTIMAPLSEVPPSNQLVHAAVTLTAHESMKLQLHLGYDGPVKVWVNGREIFCDPKGCMPSNPDDAMIPFAVRPGAHEVMVALKTNPGATWGIFLRVERLTTPSVGPLPTLPVVGV